jgi:hypothetical protein
VGEPSGSDFLFLNERREKARCVDDGTRAFYTLYSTDSSAEHASFDYDICKYDKTHFVFYKLLNGGIYGGLN